VTPPAHLRFQIQPWSLNIRTTLPIPKGWLEFRRAGATTPYGPPHDRPPLSIFHKTYKPKPSKNTPKEVVFLDRSEILERIDQLEQALLTTLNRVEGQLKSQSLFTHFFDEALRTYRHKHLAHSIQAQFLQRWLFQLHADPDLRFPHRKIIEYLLSQFDHVHNCFQRVHFSKLVKGAHIGKQTANRYLQALLAKGYVVKRIAMWTPDRRPILTPRSPEVVSV